MNCLDFRRHKLADPRRVPPQALAHLAGCAACAAFAREVDEGERALERALAVPAPEGLADRAILHARRRPRRWAPWALAASVAFMAALAFVTADRKADDLCARLAIEHVVMEPESLTTTRNADPEAFRAVLRDFGATVKALPGAVRYIRLCPEGDGFAWHVVFETPEGLATLLLVPGKPPARMETASAAGWSALARPVKGGYYAVVTPSQATTASIDRLLRERIAWKA
jgi:hypothetical protein